MTLFEEFSASYYIGQLYVERTESKYALMQRAQHEAVNEQIYATGEGVERLDLPLVVKLDTVHVPVFADERVPKETLELPEPVLAETTVENPPALREVLLATADRANQLLHWLTPYEINTSEPMPP